MTATAPAALIPVVSLAARPVVVGRWSAADRQALADDLDEWKVSITELSDARELLGLPRCSEMAPADRRYARHLVMSSRGQAAIAAAREQRALLTTGLEGCAKGAIRKARELLGLPSASPTRLRLRELAALYAQTRIVEIASEG